MIHLINSQQIAHRAEPLRPDVMLAHAEARHAEMAREHGREAADRYLAAVRAAAGIQTTPKP